MIPGRKSYNNAISEDRAKSVKAYLLSLGVEEGRISTTWYGIKYPIATNNTEEGRKLNRRVVVDILK